MLYFWAVNLRALSGAVRVSSHERRVGKLGAVRSPQDIVRVHI